MEKKIVLEEIDPVDIYGVNNRLFDILASHFPKIKAVARGAEIMLVGPQDELDSFEEKINLLVRKRLTKNNLTEYDVESLFDKIFLPAFCYESRHRADGPQSYDGKYASYDV